MSKDDSQVRHFQTVWDDNQYTTPTLINQFLVSGGPDTNEGPDGLMYLKLGHVSPPMNPEEDEDGNMILKVVEAGDYILTVKRAKELVHLLSGFISATENNSND